MPLSLTKPHSYFRICRSVSVSVQTVTIAELFLGLGVDGAQQLVDLKDVLPLQRSKFSGTLQPHLSETVVDFLRRVSQGDDVTRELVFPRLFFRVLLEQMVMNIYLSTNKTCVERLKLVR